MNDNEEPELKLSPAAEEAMAKLVELFSDPSVASKARFRCGVEGPDEFDLLFESILDEQFGYDPNSEYKQWVKRLHDLGLISRLPDEWKIEPPISLGNTGVPLTPIEIPENKSLSVSRPPKLHAMPFVEELGRRSPAGPVLEIDNSQLFAGIRL